MKNEATELIENKGSASRKIRNEATAQAAKRRQRVAQGASPASHGDSLPFFPYPSQQDDDAYPRTPNPKPRTPVFLKNEATDFVENKGSVSAKIRNEATEVSGRLPFGSHSAAGGRRQPKTANRRLPITRLDSTTFNFDPRLLQKNQEMPIAGHSLPTRAWRSLGRERGRNRGHFFWERSHFLIDIK